MLMLHKGCRQVERAELTDIPVPEARGRHRPVPHHVLAETVVGTAERLGLALQKESWGLSREGMRLYGALVEDALGEYLDRLPGFGRMHDELANSRLTDMRAKALIHDAFLEERVMAPKYLPAVSETYFHSDEHRKRFPGRNRWALYNAFTETFKREPVTLQPGSFRALTRALCLSAS